jgi:tyrosyl-tRNA synthetase
MAQKGLFRTAAADDENRDKISKIMSVVGISVSQFNYPIMQPIDV